jgi:hypothetical protein
MVRADFGVIKMHITATDVAQSNAYLDRIIKNPYAWPGGYRVWALMADGGTVSAEACKEEADTIRDNGSDDWTIVNIFVHWEGEPLICDHTGESYESEYGTGALVSLKEATA